MKAWWGDAATKDNNWCYDWLPKLDKPLRRAAGVRADEPGQDERLHLPGLQPARRRSRTRRRWTRACPSSSSWSIMDPLATETSRVLEELRRVQRRRLVRRSRPRCSACRPPASPRKTARWSTSGRWLQWHWKGAEPPGEAKTRPRDHGAGCSCACASCTARRAARFPIRSST